ncbi:hypothetical protein [Nannocystis sp. SCPEA4]|uniref:hypothetical protein n=1 Tax=Nannocystis sp. SCPEA4 TaxID=2996787 RepID=UPI00226E5487|nr:hypothetical protein [Nannocystis sp. SCPEA4]MCY1056213.1 hypothetical protein [Nannocystis sp. SCPEA4]
MQLQDSSLPTSFATFEKFALGPFVRDAPWTRFAADFPDLRALLTAARLKPREAVFFLTSDDIGVWAVPGSCERGEFERIAAALALVPEQVEGLPSAAIAARHPRTGHALVQFSPGAPLWITRAETVDALLTRLDTSNGSAGEFFAEELRDNRGGSALRICFFDASGSRYTRYDISGANLSMSGHNTFWAPVPEGQ